MPRTFAACNPQGVRRNLQSTSALGNSASCTVCYWRSGDVSTSVLFSLSPNYLLVLLTDDDDDDNDNHIISYHKNI